MTATAIFIKNCKKCGRVFYVKPTKRDIKKQFCSSYCAKSHNGTLNKGRKHTIALKRKLSERNSGINNPFYGKVHSRETKHKIGLANKGRLCGENHPNWQGGIRKGNVDGYLRITSGQFLHRKIMENFLGRKLRREENIHHINGNVLDNRVENMVILTNSEHRKLHSLCQPKDAKGRWCRRV